MTEQSANIMPRSVTLPLFSAFGVIFVAVVVAVLWSVYAPIATTIHASGKLISSSPSYNIQHPFGGTISEVRVRKQSDVAAGEILFRLDVSVQERSLEQINLQISQMEMENQIVENMLSHAEPVTPSAQFSPTMRMRYAVMRQQLDGDVKAHLANKKAARDQARSVQSGLEILQRRVAHLQDREGKMNSLVKKGVIASAATQGQTDLLLSVKAQINEQETEILQLLGQAEQAELAMESRKSQFSMALLEQLKSNEARLPQLRRQVVTLAAEIASADIRSPIPGKVVELNFDTDHMYAPRGQTLVTLSQSLNNPTVSFNIPTQAIDQVHSGMAGTLTIPSLPQRNLPKIHVVLDSISPEATEDQDGNPIGYSAKASIQVADLQALKAVFENELQLSADMPVSVALKGRQITFAQYLFAPFFQMFKGAIQD